jgi:hypothetical protein
MRIAALLLLIGWCCWARPAAAAGEGVLADVDGDGVLEIIVPTGDGNLTVVGALDPVSRALLAQIL